MRSTTPTRWMVACLPTWPRVAMGEIAHMPHSVKIVRLTEHVTRAAKCIEPIHFTTAPCVDVGVKVRAWDQAPAA
jgi:hypothetical protein